MLLKRGSKGKGGGEGRKIRISEPRRRSADKFLLFLNFDLSSLFTGIEVVYVRAFGPFLIIG